MPGNILFIHSLTFSIRRCCHRRLHFVALALLLFPSALLQGQHVYHMNVNRGLITNDLNDITLDSKGNLWIGSLSGIMKYSGTYVKSITKVGKGRDALSGSQMHSIAEDACGNIWIGTTAGLDKLDPITFEITHYTMLSPHDSTTSLGYIYAVFADRHDFVWISTDVALFKLNSHNGFYEVIPVGTDKRSVPDYIVSYNGFVETEEGTWFYTKDGMCLYSYKEEVFYHRHHNPYNKSIFYLEGGGHGNQTDIDKDTSGHFWFINTHRYLAHYDPAKDVLDTIPLPFPDGAWRCCTSIAVDDLQNIWMGFRHGGILYFEKTSQTFKAFRSKGSNRLIHSEYIHSIVNGNGKIFISHSNGLDVVDYYASPVRERLLSEENDFTSLRYEAGEMSSGDDRIIYIPFYGYGLVAYDLEGDSIRMVPTRGYLGGGTAMFYQKARQQLVAIHRNLFSFSWEGDSIRVDPDPFLPDTVTKHPGQVILYAKLGNGTQVVRKSNGSIFILKNDQVKVLSGAGFKPNLCLSPDSLALNYIDIDQRLVRHHLSTGISDTIDLHKRLLGTSFAYALPRHMVDDGKAVYITGHNGLLRYDYTDDRLSYYTPEHGLSHGFSFSIVKDAQNQIWVGSMGGIDRYDASADRFYSVYKMKDNNYMSAFGSAVMTSDGELIFHFGNRIVRVNPEDISEENNVSLKLTLHEVMVNGENVNWMQDEVLDNLHYRQNRLSFGYDLPLFNQHELVSFSYRLNGGQWTENKDRNMIHLAGLGSGVYLLEIKSSFSEDEILPVQFRIRPPWWLQWWFISLLLVLAFFSAYLFLRGRIRKYQKELQVARQLAEVESKALRAQMNPHFVFNSLNAIQECIVTNRIDEAYTYLSKFSRLLRMVLEHTDVTEISLQSELEVLNLYISLEKLRFQNEMKFEMTIDEDLEADEILIPPMLIQPHIENAIWHGLRNKPGEKQLTLHIDEKIPGYLQVMVQDNGIGRKQAEAIKQSSLGGARHQSKGRLISENRMSLLSQIYPKTNLIIEDLYDPSGNALGTRVILSIPVVQNNSLSFPNIAP